MPLPLVAPGMGHLLHPSFSAMMEINFDRHGGSLLKISLHLQSRMLPARKRLRSPRWQSVYVCVSWVMFCAATEQVITDQAPRTAQDRAPARGERSVESK